MMCFCIMLNVHSEHAQLDNILKLKVNVEKLINIAIPISPQKKLNIVIENALLHFLFSTHFAIIKRHAHLSISAHLDKNIPQASHLIFI